MLDLYAGVLAQHYGSHKPIWNTEYNVLIRQQGNTSGSLLACFQVGCCVSVVSVSLCNVFDSLACGQACRIIAAARTKVGGLVFTSRLM